uniref:Chromodomain-helicase-DNA-binding protein 7 n=1 Tax=Globodera rostochiensis TaxID=31243 RepID=A0A914GUG5_GLORO
MDDDYDNYVPQISTMDYSLLQQGGGAAGGTSTGTTGQPFLFDSGGQAPPPAHHSGRPPGCFAGMPGGHPVPPHQQYTASSGEFGGGMPAQAYPPGFCVPSMAAHMQIHHRQQQPPMGGAHGQPFEPSAVMARYGGVMPKLPPSMMAQQQQQSGTGTKTKAKKGKKTAATSATEGSSGGGAATVVEQAAGMMASASQQILPPEQYQMGYYYKGQGPPAGMLPSGHAEMIAHTAARSGGPPPSMDDQQKQQQQHFQQAQHQMFQQQYAQQQQQPPQGMYAQAAAAGQAQQSHFVGYGLQQQQQAKAAAAAAKASAQQIQQLKSAAPPGGQTAQQQQYNLQQQMFFAGQQQQQPYQQQHIQQPQAAAGQYPVMNMPSQGPGYPPMQYPTPDYPQQMAMQRQAYYAQQQQQQMMAAAGGVPTPSAVPIPAGGGSSATSSFYHQSYMNQQQQQQQQYIVQQQQQHIYRELFECDQQLSAVMPQAQQNAEAAMRAEKLQMHRGYLQSQLIQLQQHAAAAMASTVTTPPSTAGMPMPPPASADMAPLSNSSRVPQLPQQQQFMGGQQTAQYTPGTYNTVQQQQQQPVHLSAQQQQDVPLTPAQQKLQPSSTQSSALPYGAGTTASYPPTPQATATVGFHSPGSVGTQQQPPSSGMMSQPQLQAAAQQTAGQPQHQAPHFTSQHLASPSVAVMSASNQVQVNIRPEVPGRTLISVYHSQDMPPTVVSTSAAMQSPYSVPPASDVSAAAMAQSLAMVKDSIPPEPVPSNIVQEQKRRQLLLQQQQQQRDEEQQLELQQQQFQKALHSSTMSRKMALPPPPHPHSPISPIQTRDDEVVQEVQQQERQKGAAMAAAFRQRSHTSGMPQQLQEPVEQLQHRQPQQMQQPKPFWPSQAKSPEPMARHQQSHDQQVAMFGKVPTPPSPIVRAPPIKLVDNCMLSCQFIAEQMAFEACRFVWPIGLKESVIESVRVLEKKKEVKIAELDGIDQSKDVGQQADDVGTFEAVLSPKMETTTTTELIVQNEESLNTLDLSHNEKMPSSEMNAMAEQEDAEINVEPKSIKRRVPDEEVEMATEEPSIDTEPEAALTPSMSDTCLNRQDDKESAVDDSPWPEVSTKETTPMDVEEQLSFSVKHQQSSSTTSSLAYAFVGAPSSSSKGSAKQQRNKKRKLDWNRRDEDDDYVSRSKSTRAVPSSSKRRARREAVGTDVDEEDGTAMMAALDAQMLLVEKRRSTRKVTGEKKAKYGVDSDDDADGGGANGQKAPKAAVKMQQQPPQLVELEEKIVDKILGVRIGKRKVMKNKGGAKKEKKDDNKEEMPIGQQKEKEEKSGEKGEEEKETEEKKETKKEEEEREGEEASSMKETPEEEAKEEEVEMEEVEVEELYAKYKNYSYLHCEWKTLEELEEMGNKRALTKLNRYKQKGGETTTIAGEDDEQEYFNEDYTVVSRILDETYDEQEQQHYVFVKWRGLSYDDCTWELLQNVPEQKVEEFRQRSIFDPCKAREQPDRRLSAAEFGQLAVPKDKVYKNDNMLREYQHEGVNWLLWTWTNGRNCILADEMGLGKTVQSIAFFQSLYDTGIHGPFLVVVPLSTLSNWEREFENWTNINVVVYHGVALSRQIIQNYEFYYKKSDRRRVIKFDAMITTYEVVVQDVEVLRKINFRVCVIDEAHRLKNRNCKLLQTGLLSLKMDYRVLLTGTPLQNNIQELFSLLNFLEPEQFGNSEAFLQQFGQCQTEDQVQKLQEILKPMMLRRLKEDVEKELQPKEETIIEVQLSNIQKKYYRAVLERNFTHLMKGTTPSLISLNNTMMQLRKCCNHPYLINGAEEQILSEVKQSHPDKMEEEIQAMALISSSGKLVLIDKLLPKLHADGHKVLIFSQMVRVLDLLEEYLNIKGYPFERIDGNIRGNDRQAAIDRFSRPDSYDRFVFLLCTRAGGLGINLTTADTVVLFDSDWNPQNDLQAQARCHRIGQTKPVKIYRLITANSYEREMFDKASLKLGLDKAVLQSMLNNKGENNQQMSRQEVEDLLRKGAYGAIMDDNEGTKFSEEDIDTILLRRTQTIRLEPGVKGSTFAKASFTSSHNREDITIQDPDFWSKWARKANIDVNSLNDEFSTKHLIVHEPRARKKRFEADNFKGTSESGDDGCSDEDDRSQSTPGPGTSKIAEGVKSRSSKRRRRGAAVGAGGEDDEDYPYKPDELAFNKTSYFKVEKLLAQFGWGRWVMLKAFSDLTEHELEHITRTLLLHCVREFRGDEKVREYVWNLITPSHGTSKSIKTEEKKSTPTAADSNSRYHQGWAALPEYNPPFICVDASFQRHLHRHSNKILNRIQQLHFLHSNVVTTTHQSKTAEDAGNGTTAVADGYELKMELPETLDKWLIMSSWDRLCDRDLLIGVHKHGMENWEQVRADDKLCYTQKNIHFPNTLDLNNRFKYLISVLQRSAELAAKSANAPEASIVEWTKVEESDFMRILRNYGVKDDTNSQNVINWGRFRELSICLHKKTDKELLEMLYCVLAMCTCVQSGHEGLSAMDEGRAERVDAISAKAGEKLMNRLHLMRKVHAIITMGIQNIRGMLKMVALDVMPKGWTEAHDEHLLIVVDKFGLEDIHGKVKLLPKLFESVGPIDEHMLLRRVVEICLTLETGKWSGPASIDMLQEDSHQPPHQHLLPSTSGAAQQQQQQAAGANARNSTTTAKASATAGNGRKKLDQPTTIRKGNGQQQQTATTIDKSKVISTPSITFNEQQALIKMMEQMSNPNYLLSLMSLMNPTAAMSGTNGSSNTTAASSTAALQQHFQQLQTLLSLSALSGGAIVDPTLASLSASLAALTGGNSTTPSSVKLPPPSAGSNSGGGSSVITTTAAAASESATKMDALNLSKRNTQEDRTPTSKASKATPSKGTAASKSMPTSGCGPSQIGTLSSTSSSSTSKQQHCGSSAAASAADTLGSLSTGLSTSAINKLSQMSVPELLAYSNLSQEIRIPVVHIESGQRFDSEKAPTLKNLDQWLKSNPKYNVDLLSLATSHPSLFSSSTSSAMPSSSGSRISTPKVSTAQKQHSSSAIDNTQKSLKAATTSLGTEKNDVAAANVSALSLSSSNASSVTQQLIEQAKKCSTTTTAAAAAAKDASGQTSIALPSSSYSASSLFGLGGGADFHGSGGACTSSTAAQMAAINQLLSGLAPTGVSAQTASQLQATNLAAATALATSAAAAAASTSCSSGGGSSHQHQSIKSIEQQMLLLQQTMALGGLGSGGGTSVINPYASFLYQNPADLFDIKSGQQQLFGGGTSSSISASALQSSAPQQQSSSSSVTSAEQQAIAALAAAAAAAGFPTMTSSVAAKGGSASTATADMNALSAAAALSSADLYLAAMASSFPPFLGGTGGSAMSNNLFQVNQQQQHQTSSTTPSTAALSSSSSLAGMNAALEQLFQAAGMDASALMMGLNTAATPAMPTPPYHQQQKGAAHQTSSTNSAGPSGIGDGSSNSSLFASSTKSVLTKVESAKTISLPLMASTIASSRQQQQRESPARKMGMTFIGGPKGLKLNAVLEKLNASSSSCSSNSSGVTTTHAAAMSNEQLQQQQQTEAVPSSVQPQKQERERKLSRNHWKSNRTCLMMMTTVKKWMINKWKWMNDGCAKASFSGIRTRYSLYINKLTKLCEIWTHIDDAPPDCQERGAPLRKDGISDPNSRMFNDDDLLFFDNFPPPRRPFYADPEFFHGSMPRREESPPFFQPQSREPVSPPNHQRSKSHYDNVADNWDSQNRPFQAENDGIPFDDHLQNHRQQQQQQQQQHQPPNDPNVHVIKIHHEGQQPAGREQFANNGRKFVEINNSVPNYEDKRRRRSNSRQEDNDAGNGGGQRRAPSIPNITIDDFSTYTDGEAANSAIPLPAPAIPLPAPEGIITNGGAKQQQNNKSANVKHKVEELNKNVVVVVDGGGAERHENWEQNLAELSMQKQEKIDGVVCEKEDLLQLFDETEHLTEQLRENAIKLEQEKETILDKINTIKASGAKLTKLFSQGERDGMMLNVERILARCNTVNVSIETPRDQHQSRALEQVNKMIQSVLDHSSGNVVESKQKILGFLNACHPDEVGNIDEKFQSAIIECTADDQKKIRRKLAQIVEQINLLDREKSAKMKNNDCRS